MSDQTDNLLFLLKPFGLSQEEAHVYLNLLEKAVSTALQISRDLHLGRTKVYRILDKLINKHLVIQKVDSAGLKFLANDPSQLELLLSQQEAETTALRNSLPEILQSLKNIHGVGVPGSKILYYQGKQGLSRVNWNLLKAKEELLSYEVATASSYMPQAEAEQMRLGIVKNQILVRTLTNKKIYGPYTEVSELIKKWSQIRFISPDILPINLDIFIYNDVYSICHYLDGGDIFCLEIINKQLVLMQKMVFENLWKKATKLEYVNLQGKAILGKKISEYL